MRRIIVMVGLATALLPPLLNLWATELFGSRPILAIWQDSAGMLPSKAPYLRIAIWEDGRVVFAEDPGQWNHELRLGRIDDERLAELKKAIKGTGVFDLGGKTYLVPDAPVDCMLLAFDNQEQLSHWDEIEGKRYGINIDPKPHHLQFMKCWKEVNRLALEAIPKESEPFPGKFELVPKSWKIREAVQSE